MNTFTVAKSGSLTLPKSLLAECGLQPGDTVVAVETHDGLKLLRQPDLDEQLKLARYILKQWHDIADRTGAGRD